MPTASPLFIDKIALTIALHDVAARERIQEWFHSPERTVFGVPVLPTRGSRFYWFSREIIFNPETRCKLLVEFGPRAGAVQQITEYDGDPESEPDLDLHAVTDPRRPLRLEWNPDQIAAQPEYQAAFNNMMQFWFGEALSAEMLNARITRIDLATDIRGLNIDRIIAARSDTTVVSTTYGRDGITQSHYLGSKNSDLRFVIYDKRAQQRGRVRGGQYERTRIEVRIKQRLTISSLRAYANPFQRLTIREVQQLIIGRQNSPHIWTWFVDSCKRRGGEGALDLINNARTLAEWHNRVRVREEPTWWDSEVLWDGLDDAINRLDLFPRSRVRRRPRPYVQRS